MPDERALYREILYWRDLLSRVAADLELKAGTEMDAGRARWAATRAMRIRRRLYEGMPPTFDPSPNRPPPRFDRVSTPAACAANQEVVGTLDGHGVGRPELEDLASSSGNPPRRLTPP